METISASGLCRYTRQPTIHNQYQALNVSYQERQERDKRHMLKAIRQWHQNLLHETWGLPEHEPGKHPPVAAHGQRLAQPHLAQRRLTSRPNPSFQEQLEREKAHEPQVLAEWQRRIGDLFERRTPFEQ